MSGIGWRRWVALLVPRDELGEALLGDWEETRALWLARHGRLRSELLFLADILRSIPGLLWSACAERGWKAALRRSLPAVFAGCVLALAPLGVGGASIAPTLLRQVGIGVSAAFLAVGAGWAASRVAGAAPRLHALAAGALAATAAMIAAARGDGGALHGIPAALLLGTSLGGVVHAARAPQRGRGEVRIPSAVHAAALTALLVGSTLTGCTATAELDSDPVQRVFLSGDADDWEPSLAVGPEGGVVVVAGRHVPAGDPGRGPMGGSDIVTWFAPRADGAFLQERVLSPGGGDERIALTIDGTFLATWIAVQWREDGTIDPERSGLELARSTDHGEGWSRQMVANVASGVADKPELATSPDGDTIHIAFMGPGTLDVVTSDDGGETWLRSVADSGRAGHWPSGIARSASGALHVADVRQQPSENDSVLSVAVSLLRSNDGGRSFTIRRLTEATRSARPDRCVHGPACPVQIPFASVAVDREGGVFVAYTSGQAGAPYTLHWLASSDDGNTWSEVQMLPSAPRAAGDGPADVYYPMVAAGPAGELYLVWFDDRAGPLGVFARRSMDRGLSWSEAVRLSPSEGLRGIYGEYGGAAVDESGVLHVTWADGQGHVGAPGASGGTWYARWDGRAPDATGPDRVP
ncbi:MAG: sialidase family protein [Gemmatimonadota bacterium]